MRSRGSLTAFVAAAALVLASCGGAGGGGASPTTEPSDAEPTAEVVLGTTVHYAGFALTLDKAVLRNTTLLVTGRAENLGPTSADPPLNVTIDLAGTIIETDPGRSILPMVTSAATADVAYGFAVPRDTDLSTAVLFIGAAAFARVQVPLGSVGTLVTNAPAAVGLTGELEVGNSIFHFEGGELRYDEVTNYAQAEAGVGYLRLTFSLDNLNTKDAYPFGSADVMLKTPSGELLPPRTVVTGVVPPAGSTGGLAASWNVKIEPGDYAFVGLRGAGTQFETRAEKTFTL
ncbi:MAG: hypothetical protein ACT452_08905 [Microthrixaceae bacterium]